MKRKLQEIDEYLEVHMIDGKAKICCKNCGYELCDATKNYKNYALKHVGPVTELPHTRGPKVYNLEVIYELRQFFCPNCRVLFRTDIAQEGDPFQEDFSFRLPQKST